MASSPFEVNQFVGGITDDSFDGDLTRSVELDNVGITPDGHPLSRPGSVVDDTVNPLIPAGNARIGVLINYNFDEKLFVGSGKDIFYRNPSAYSILQGANGNSVFNQGSTAASVSYSQWNKHVFLTNDLFPSVQKMYKDGSGNYKVVNAGLPSLATNPTVAAGASGTGSYLYSFHYQFDYTCDTSAFEDVGPVTQVKLSSANAPNTNAVPITNIPVISNGLNENFDTGHIKVIIYRTINGGTASYKVGEVMNGTTTFSDNVSDTNLQAGIPLYIDDGTLDLDPAPKSKFLHIVNNVGLYGYIYDGTTKFPNKLRQSVPGSPGSCPVDLDLDVEEGIKGISSIKGIPIVACENYIYRLEGSFDQFGKGNLSYTRIHDSAGCVSNNSMVQAENVLLWAGNDGFYASDGYQVFKISDHLNTRYQSYLANTSSKTRISGKYDRVNRKVMWTVQKDSSTLENDSLIILDLRYPLNSKSTFTTWSGASFRPSALEIFKGNIIRGGSKGYVFTHNPGYFTDPKVDTTITASSWGLETIIWTVKTLKFNFGNTFDRKIATRILLTAANQGNTTIALQAINDDGRLTRDLQPIRWRRNFTWRDITFTWGNADCVWNSVGLIEQWRRFPSKGLRLSYLQIIISNAFGIITNSDSLGTATFNKSARTVTLDNALAQDWPPDSLDYVITHAGDGYTRQYTVTTVGLDTLVVADPDGTLPNGSLKWELKGYQKGEPLELLSYNIHWQNIAPSQSTFTKGQDGGNS